MMPQIVARIHPRLGQIARPLAALLLASLVPACYSSSGKTYMAPPPPPGGAGTLVSDGFFPYPNANWAGATGSNASSSAPLSAGGQYFLTFADTSRPGTISDMTVMTFSSEALTFKIDFQSSATSTVSDLAMVQIVDSASTTTVLAEASYNAVTGQMTCSVGATSFAPIVFGAGTFQTLTFTIDASLNGTWLVGATTAGTAAFGTHSTKFKLVGTWSATAGTAPTFLFDNLDITNP